MEKNLGRVRKLRLVCEVWSWSAREVTGKLLVESLAFYLMFAVEF